MILNEGERLDYVNENLSLIQNEEGLTFGTDALLLAAYCYGRRKNGIELGGGSGIISMLLLARGKLESCLCLEVQEEYVRLIKRNAELNGLSDRLTAVLGDVRDFRPGSECELVYSNPPYMKADSGRRCENDKKNIARHEVFGTILDFCKCASVSVKYGGSFLVVYRPDRMCDLIWALRECGLEPKRMTLVHADTESQPSMLLCEAKRGGKSGMKLTRPLFLYNNRAHTEESDDLKYILAEGVFPPDFEK